MNLSEDNSYSQSVSSVRLLAAMFLLGAFSTLAQVIFFREMLVVFFGNELVIGIILAGWFTGISLGAFAARAVPSRFVSFAGIEMFLAAALCLMSLLLPFQIYAVKIVRLILAIPAGEYAPLWSVLSGSFLIFLPTCLGTGLIFPLACELLQQNGGSGKMQAAIPVSRIYAWESLGSMLGGAALTFLLLPAMSLLRIVLVAVCLGLFASAVAGARRKFFQLSAFASVCVLLVVGFRPETIDIIERWAVERQWRAFGVLGGITDGRGNPATHLRASEDSVYQNLAITESEGQFVMYSNGKVLFVFPDPIDYEHRVHFLMAQNPAAKRILLIGGNPLGEIPELLKYPLERLVCVEIDPSVGRLIGRVMPHEYEEVRKDGRISFVVQDAPGFVQSCVEKFDVVIINAPEPSTVGANRFYTLEFYRNIRRILGRNGFVYTALNSSERLQSEAADLGASIYRTIRSVFPVVLVTAESQNRFIAGNPGSDLTFERATLCERSERAAVSNRFFQSKYFLGADEIDPEKTKFVEGRFLSADVPLNTNLRPVACFYSLILWSRFSGSGIESYFARLRSIDSGIAAAWITAFGLVMLVVAFLIRVARGKLDVSEVPCIGWTRLMAAILIASTGFCGISLEVVLIFIFQGLYGYVYSMMGVIVAVFMLGLVLGASSGRMMTEKGVLLFWFSLALVEVLVIVCALAVPELGSYASIVSGSKSMMKMFEVIIYVIMGIIGWAVGAEFPLVNRLYSVCGGSVRSSAAVTDAADHLGAAIGAVAAGVVLVPVLGIASACMLIASIKFLGLLCLVAAFVSVPRRLE